MELAPFVVVDHFEPATASHSSNYLSATHSTASSLSAALSTPSASSPASASSQPCPQPSPLSSTLAASLMEPTAFSLDSVPGSVPPEPASAAASHRAAAYSSFGFRHFLSGLSVPFAPVPHRLRWARCLFRLLSHPLTLLCSSMTMLTLQMVLLSASTHTLYLLYTASSPQLPPLPTAVFTAFLCFLIFRSCAYLTLLSIRLLNVALWVNVPPATASRVARNFYPALLLLRVLSLLFLLVATATLIFATSLTLSSPTLLMIFILLSYDAVTLSLPLLIVPALAFLLPLHTLHMSFPFIPLTHPLPAQPKPGMSASQLALLGECVWQQSLLDDAADVCAVCLCELSEGERVRRLPKCSHVFHVVCIDSWLERRAKCPLCVQTVDVGAAVMHGRL